MMRTLALCGALLCALAPLGAQGTPKPQGPTLALRAGLVLPMNGPAIPDGIVLVRNGRIAAVSSAKGYTVPKGVALVHRPNAVVTPGFVDAACFVGSRRQRRDEGPADSRGLALAPALDRDPAAARAALEAGVTLMHVISDRQPVVGGLSALVRPTAKGALALVHDKARLVASLHARSWNPNEPPSNLMGGLQRMRELRASARWRELLAQDGALMAHVGEPRELEALARLGSEGPKTAALVHGGIFERATAGEALTGLAGVVLMPMADRPAHERSAAKSAVQAKLRFAFGSSAPFLPSAGLRYQAVLARMAGVPADRALAGLTVDAAALVGAADEAGILAVGRRADLLVWDRHPTEPTARLMDVHLAGTRVAGLRREDEG